MAARRGQSAERSLVPPINRKEISSAVGARRFRRFAVSPRLAWTRARTWLVNFDPLTVVQTGCGNVGRADALGQHSSTCALDTAAAWASQNARAEAMLDAQDGRHDRQRPVYTCGAVPWIGSTRRPISRAWGGHHANRAHQCRGLTACGMSPNTCWT